MTAEDGESLGEDGRVDVGAPERPPVGRFLDDCAGVADEGRVDPEHLGDRPGASETAAGAKDGPDAGRRGPVDCRSGGRAQHPRAVEKRPVHVERQHAELTDPPAPGAQGAGFPTAFLTGPAPGPRWTAGSS